MKLYPIFIRTAGEKRPPSKERTFIRHIFSLFVALFCLSATPSPAQGNVTVRMDNATIMQVIRHIESTAGYAFIFTDSSREQQNKTVSVNFTDSPLRAVLADLFKNTDLSFNIEGNQVAVFLKPAPPAPPRVRYSGIVTDDNNYPIIGATVTVPDRSRGEITDQYGRYSMEVPAGSPLIFSSLGYDPQEINTPADGSTLNVQLTETATEIEQVVIVGYGVQTKASTVASITQTTGEEIMGAGNVNTVSEAIQGRLNGVTAIQQNGKPGDSAAEIFIRGKSSWQGSSPLILVDGVERSMNDIDMNEIATLSVLKDASATAVYGTRGGNGVILVTTKRGKEGSRPVINFSANFALKEFTQMPYYADYLTSMDMWNQAAANDKKWDMIIPESTVDAWTNAFATGNYGPYNDYFPNVNWYDFMVTKPGLSQNYNANVSGGSNWLNYFASIGFQHDGDIYNISKQPDFDPRNFMQRYNWRSNFDFKVTKSTTITMNIAGRMQYVNGSVESGFNKLMQAPINTFPIKYSDGYWGDNAAGEYNPYANFNMQGQVQSKSIIGWYDFVLDQKLDFLTRGLSVQAKLSYNNSTTTNSSIRKGRVLGQDDAVGMKSYVRYYRTYDYANPIQNADGTLSYPLLTEKRYPNELTPEDLPVSTSYDNLSRLDRRLYYEFSVNYNRNFGDHNVTLLALMNRQIHEPGTSSVMEFPSYREDWVGRATYNWKQRYLAEFNISYTGSEKFAPGRRFGLFPSISVGWRASEEPFIKRTVGSWLTNLKFRYSYGQVGTDNISERFAYIQLYTQDGSVSFGQNSEVLHSPVYTEGRTSNPKSTWETATKQNMGIELELWRKLSVTLDLFDEKRDGLLMLPETTALWFGAGLPYVNTGKTKNHGLELEVAWNDHLAASGVGYWVNFNFAASENRIVFRDDPFSRAEHLKHEGKPIGWQSRYLSVGNYGSLDDIYNHAQTAISGANPGLLIPGDLVYIDYDGDGIINGNDQVAVAEMNYPLTTFGLNLGVSWKGLSLSALLYAPINVYKLVPHPLLWDFPQNNVKAQPDFNRWTVETANSTAVLSPPPHHERQHNVQNNTYSYRNYSYLRIKNLELSYNLPQRWMKALNMTGASVFVKGNNLWSFSSVDKRVDPETNDVSSYPIVRTYTMGLRLSF